MKRGGLPFGRMLAVALVIAGTLWGLASCSFDETFVEYCQKTGQCDCTSGVCCALSGATCDPHGRDCCKGLTCNLDGVCRNPLAGDGGTDAGH